MGEPSANEALDMGVLHLAHSPTTVFCNAASTLNRASAEIAVSGLKTPLFAFTALMIRIGFLTGADELALSR
jgi:hypothetical protein